MSFKKNGFTLIELLVVIAIIAILAAILFPVFARAKQSANVSGCSSNLKQIYAGLAAYCDDYDGKLPNADHIEGFVPPATRSSMTQKPDPRQIHSKLLKYTGNKLELFRCPADKVIPRMAGGVFDMNDPRISTCDFAIFGSSYQWRDRIREKLLSSFTSPSKLSIARDAVPFHMNHTTATIENWHQKGSGGNAIFMDGHVKFVHGDAFLADL
jgi:prepilin-type N-terminal cleavage/methylation domain-containing protein/prepilin-type processing-associated H-X9-DG protein